MPMPKPKKGESKKDFLERCMGNDTMVEDYPDNKQRYAICNDIWRDKEKDNLQNPEQIENIKMEIRSYPIELREDESDQSKLIGYAAVFNKLSDDLGGFREKIKKGAFAETIEEDDIRALFNHDPNYVLGRTSNNTLKLEEDNHGLKIEIIPPETQFARDLMLQVRRKDIDQMSFGFITLEDKWNREDEDNVERTLLKVQLFDVSPVTFPAYPQTQVGVRSPQEVYRTFKQDLEALFQEEEAKLEEQAKAQERKAALRKINITLIKEEIK